MLPTKKETRGLTEQQENFLTALFGEAHGSPKKAGEIAGYALNSYPKVVKALKEEILERAEYSLALNSAKAVKGLVDALDELADDTDYIEPVQEELDALEEAKEY